MVCQALLAFTRDACRSVRFRIKAARKRAAPTGQAERTRLEQLGALPRTPGLRDPPTRRKLLSPRIRFFWGLLEQLKFAGHLEEVSK